MSKLVKFEDVIEVLANSGMDYSFLVENLQSLPTQESKEDWVSIDTPPTKDKEFNVCYKMPNGKWDIFIARYLLTYKRFDSGDMNITHWQPLPTPPKV